MRPVGYPAGAGTAGTIGLLRLLFENVTAIHFGDGFQLETYRDFC